LTFGGRRKSNSKLAENQPSLLIFPATNPFSAFSLHRGFQPPPSSSPVFSSSSPPPVAIKPSHVVVAPLLSLPSVKIPLLCHCDLGSIGNSRSSGHHLAQKLFPFPKAARVVAFSSATPTAPTASFPSPLQASVSSSSSRGDQSQPPASPPQPHHAPPVRPPAPSTPGKPPSSLLILLPLCHYRMRTVQREL